MYVHIAHQRESQRVFSRYKVSVSIQHVLLSNVPCHIQSDTSHREVQLQRVFSRYNVSISIRHVPLSGVPCHIQSGTSHCEVPLQVYELYCTYFPGITCLFQYVTFLCQVYHVIYNQTRYIHLPLMPFHRKYGIQYSALVKNTFFVVTFCCQSDTLHPSSSDAFPQKIRLLRYNVGLLW